MNLKVIALILSLISSLSFAQDRTSRLETQANSLNKTSMSFEDIKNCDARLYRVINKEDENKELRMFGVDAKDGKQYKFIRFAKDNTFISHHSTKFQAWFLLNEKGFFKYKNQMDHTLDNNLESLSNDQNEALKTEKLSEIRRRVLDLMDKRGWGYAQFMYANSEGNGYMSTSSVVRWRKAFCECQSSGVAAKEIRLAIHSMVHDTKIKVINIKNKDERPLRENDFACEFQGS